MDIDPPPLSKEVKETLARAQGVVDKEFAPELDPELAQAVLEADGIKAAYKIEILFGPKRTTNGPNVCLVQLWESGKHFHGGGDSILYTCLDHRKLDPQTTRPILLGMQKTPDHFTSFGGCGRAIPSSSIGSGVAFCPHCKRGVNAEFLAHMLPFKNTTQELAEVLVMIYHQLNDACDLYCKYFRDDIRYQAGLKTYGEEKGRRLRGLSIYPLKNLIKDVSGGASLEGRFRTFLSS